MLSPSLALLKGFLLARPRRAGPGREARGQAPPRPGRLRRRRGGGAAAPPGNAGLGAGGAAPPAQGRGAGDPSSTSPARIKNLNCYEILRSERFKSEQI